MKRLLLLSNSANKGQQRLSHATDWITEFLGPDVKTITLIAFAAIPGLGAEFVKEIRKLFEPIFTRLGYKLIIPAEDANAVGNALQQSDAIIMTGGNSYYLLYTLHKLGLIPLLRQYIESGTPYIGWSAGSNVTCPTIMTTNDMAVCYPSSHKALNLIPFQINPHYPDAGNDINPAGGETREDRLTEYMRVNPDVPVVGLREGTALLVEGNSIKLLGNKDMRVYFGGQTPPVKEMRDVSEFYKPVGA